MVGGGERWDTEPRVGRVGLLAVAVRGVGGARRADWDVGMFRWAGRGGPLAQRCPGKTAGAARDRSVVELVGQGLVEHEVGDELDFGGIEGRSLVEQEVSLTTLRAVPGPRAGEIGGGMCGSSRCSRMATTTNGSVRKERILIVPPRPRFARCPGRAAAALRRSAQAGRPDPPLVGALRAGLVGRAGSASREGCGLGLEPVGLGS